MISGNLSFIDIWIIVSIEMHMLSMVLEASLVISFKIEFALISRLNTVLINIKC